MINRRPNHINRDRTIGSQIDTLGKTIEQRFNISSICIIVRHTECVHIAENSAQFFLVVAEIGDFLLPARLPDRVRLDVAPFYQCMLECGLVAHNIVELLRSRRRLKLPNEFVEFFVFIDNPPDR